MINSFGVRDLGQREKLSKNNLNENIGLYYSNLK